MPETPRYIECKDDDAPGFLLSSAACPRRTRVGIRTGVALAFPESNLKTPLG